MERYVIIDLQWYIFNRNHLLPKELASCDINGRISHFVFKPVISFASLTSKDRNVDRYVYHNHHKLKWEAGFTELGELDEIIRQLCHKVDIVYVKGEQKAKFLRRIVNKRVMDLVEANKVLHGKPMCTFHASDSSVCALSNVQALYNYLQH